MEGAVKVGWATLHFLGSMKEWRLRRWFKILYLGLLTMAAKRVKESETVTGCSWGSRDGDFVGDEVRFAVRTKGTRKGLMAG